MLGRKEMYLKRVKVKKRLCQSVNCRHPRKPFQRQGTERLSVQADLQELFHG